MTETDLRWQLRQLPREIDPPRDLWPGIADGMSRRPATPRRSWVAGSALAASVVLALGLAWRLMPAPDAAPSPDLTAQLVQREAAGMTAEYQAALRQFEGAPLADTLAPDLRTLDRSADQIRSALAADPDSVALLQQLRRTYSRRLALTQRAVTG